MDTSKTILIAALMTSCTTALAAGHPSAQSGIAAGGSLGARFGENAGAAASLTTFRLQYERQRLIIDSDEFFWGGSVHNDFVSYTIDSTVKSGVRQGVGAYMGVMRNLPDSGIDISGAIEWLPFCQMTVGSSETSVVNGRDVQMSTLSEMRGSAGFEIRGAAQKTLNGWKPSRNSQIRYGVEAGYIRQPFATKKDRVAVGDSDMRPETTSTQGSTNVALTGFLGSVFLGFRF